jgi:hypothetical protein
MVNRVVLGVAVGAASLAALVACDALVDLGPTATLRDAGGPPPIEAGIDSRANAPDTGAPDADSTESGLSCGLAPAGNKGCDDCSNQYCCGISIACGKNPQCVVGEQQLVDCVFDAVCVSQVDTEFADAGVVDLQNCVVNYCTAACFPGPVCSMLAGCCKDVPDAQVVARQVCIGAVNLLDENNCMKVLVDTLRRELGSQFCGGPAPDAGGD